MATTMASTVESGRTPSHHAPRANRSDPPRARTCRETVKLRKVRYFFAIASCLLSLSNLNYLGSQWNPRIKATPDGRPRGERRGNAPQGSDKNKNSRGKINVAFVTYSHMTNVEDFENTVLATAETWLPSWSTYYVVLNRKWETSFTKWKKQKVDAVAFQNTANASNASAFGREGATDGSRGTRPGIHRIRPIFVDCPEAKFGESPCCKQQEGLVRFHDEVLSEGESGSESDYDWIVYADDDMYFCSDTLDWYLHFLPIESRKHREYLAEASAPPEQRPVILTPWEPKFLGQFGYFRSRSPYRCSKEGPFKYPWGQPAVYNRAALALLTPGLRQKGLVRQCLEFNVTHDVGNAIFHWMYSIPTARFRGTDPKVSTHDRDGSAIRDDTVSCHGLGSSRELDMRAFHAGAKSRAKVQKWNPGNGSDHASGHTPEGYFYWTRATGFQRTETFRRFGPPQEWEEWHTMPTSDCDSRQ